MKLHKYFNALQDAHQLINTFPNSAVAWGRLGATLYKINHYDTALLAYEKANELKSDIIYINMINVLKNNIFITKMNTSINKILYNDDLQDKFNIYNDDKYQNFDNTSFNFNNDNLDEVNYNEENYDYYNDKQYNNEDIYDYYNNEETYDEQNNEENYEQYNEGNYDEQYNEENYDEQYNEENYDEQYNEENYDEQYNEENYDDNYDEQYNNDNNYGEQYNNDNNYDEQYNNDNNYDEPDNNDNNYDEPDNNDNNYDEPDNNGNNYDEPDNNGNNYDEQDNKLVNKRLPMQTTIVYNQKPSPIFESGQDPQPFNSLLCQTTQPQAYDPISQCSCLLLQEPVIDTELVQDLQTNNTDTADSIATEVSTEKLLSKIGQQISKIEQQFNTERQLYKASQQLKAESPSESLELQTPTVYNQKPSPIFESGQDPQPCNSLLCQTTQPQAYDPISQCSCLLLQKPVIDSSPKQVEDNEQQIVKEPEPQLEEPELDIIQVPKPINDTTESQSYLSGIFKIIF
jgi:hypothetical protein